MTLSCRICQQYHLKQILSFGKTPIADRLLNKDQLSQPPLRVPLDLYFCPNCTLVQIAHTVDPTLLFCQDYPYFSSVSPQLLQHFHKSANQLIQQFHLNSDSLVIEAASNDGYMLQNFLDENISVLGIDPAKKQAECAQRKGIPTLNTFFTQSLADKLAQECKQADLFLANNVLAHVPDLNGFVKGIYSILKQSGTAVLEVPYLLNLIDRLEFDTIYHQHLCYFSVTALNSLFRSHKLFLNDITQVALHGGSLRLFIEKKENQQQSVRDLLKNEEERKSTSYSFYQTFSKQLTTRKKELTSLLTSLRSQGKSIAAYGAAAKATTFSTYMQLNSSLIDYVVDLSSIKHGKYIDGPMLQIFPVDRLQKERPDYTLIFAWNFEKEIIQQQHNYLEQGGAFITPIPELVITRRDSIEMPYMLK